MVELFHDAILAVHVLIMVLSLGGMAMAVLSSRTAAHRVWGRRAADLLIWGALTAWLVIGIQHGLGEGVNGLLALSGGVLLYTLGQGLVLVIPRYGRDRAWRVHLLAWSMPAMLALLGAIDGGHHSEDGFAGEEHIAACALAVLLLIDRLRLHAWRDDVLWRRTWHVVFMAMGMAWALSAVSPTPDVIVSSLVRAVLYQFAILALPLGFLLVPAPRRAAWLRVASSGAVNRTSAIAA